MYIRVIPFSGSFDTFGLTYHVSDALAPRVQIGQIVSFGLRAKEILGIVAEILSEVPHFQNMKDIESILTPEVIFSRHHIATINFMAQYYFTPIHAVAQLFFPKSLQGSFLKAKYFDLPEKKYVYESRKNELNLEQDAMVKNILSDEKQKHLLYGVTGSGKTHIYISLIEKKIQEGKQVLLLIPEILLSTQIGEKMQEYFGKNVILIHSGVTESKRIRYWKDIAQGNAQIIIGTRSSLFFPYRNLGLIILDEEHDMSYISDSAPRYHVAEVAEYIATLNHIPLVYGSGTPRIETLYRALSGEIALHQLLQSYQEI